MTICDRWRNWTPKPTSPNAETSKPSFEGFGGFEGSISEGIPVTPGGFEGFGGSISRDVPITPVSWGEELHRWMLTRCEFKDRCFGGMNCLHLDWCEWVFNSLVIVEKSNEFLSRTGFYLQISELGFLVADDLVYGLLLRDFCISAENEPPKPSKPTSSAKIRTPKTFKTPKTGLSGRRA